jgi:uncharacterized protein (DUF58 family)
MISKKTIMLFAAGIPVTMLGLAFSQEVACFLIYNFIILCLIVIDFFITPKKDILRIERLVNEKFIYGIENSVKIKVQNTSERELKINLKDCFNKNFDSGNEEVTFKFDLEPKNETIKEYFLKPFKRGRFPFYSIFIKYEGVLGLINRVYKFDIPSDVKVFPNATPAYKYRMLVNKHQLSDSSRKLKAKAIGTQIESLKEYSQGDEYRKINWNATAKMNKLIVNEYDLERNQNIFIMLDCGRTMGSIIGMQGKSIISIGSHLDWAVSTASVISEISAFNKDRVGFMCFDSTVQKFLQPGNNNSKVILNSIYDVQPNEKASNYKAALSFFDGRVKKRSLICIFTNFNNEAEVKNLASGLDIILRKHAVMIVLLEDPNLKFNYENKNCTKKIEYISDEKENKNKYKQAEDIYMDVAKQHIKKEKEELIYKLKKKGVAFVYAPPEDLAFKSIVAYMNLKVKVS